MNFVNWLKRNWMVAAVVLVFVLALGGMLWLLQSARTRRGRLVAELQQQRETLGQILRSPIFPSRDNLRILRQDRETLEQKGRTLRQAVGKAAMDIGDTRGLDPIEFSKRKDKAVERLRSITRQKDVVVPEAFDFGFSRYRDALPCQNLPTEECRRVLAQMLRQLAVVEKLTQLLVNSPVQEIRQVKRVDIEPGGGSSPDALSAAIADDPNALYHTMPFELQFACNTEQLRTFLNSLSQSEWLFAVRLLTVTTVAGKEVPVVQTKKAVAGDESGRLLVTVRIDLVEFPGAQTRQPAERKESGP